MRKNGRKVKHGQGTPTRLTEEKGQDPGSLQEEDTLSTRQSHAHHTQLGEAAFQGELARRARGGGGGQSKLRRSLSEGRKDRVQGEGILGSSQDGGGTTGGGGRYGGPGWRQRLAKAVD